MKLVLLSLYPVKRDVPVNTTVSGLTVILLNFTFFKNLNGINVKPGQEFFFFFKKKGIQSNEVQRKNNNGLYLWLGDIRNRKKK